MTIQHRKAQSGSAAYAVPRPAQQNRPEEIHVGDEPEADEASDFSPPVDVVRAEDRLLVTLEAPGAEHDSLSVTVRGAALHLKGYKPPLGPAGHGSSASSARAFGSFHERIPLPDEARTDDIHGEYEQGILSVTVPLGDTQGARTIPIQQS